MVLAVHECSSLSISSPTLGVSPLFGLSQLVILYLIMVFICISLVSNDAERLFIYLSAIWISSFGKYLFKTFAQFQLGCFLTFLLICRHSLHILDTSAL